MTELETAKLYTVSGSLDRPVEDLIVGQTEVEIQFNPTSLKVVLANTIGENERSGSRRAAQFIDKSSSTLTVELIFDTTDQYFTRKKSEESEETEEVRVDVRSKTRPIAQQFMKPVDVGNKHVAPKRCLFAWGTFAFVGIMESFDETLEFFSSKGTPLRATVSLKLTESRFQFRSEAAKAAERDTPTLGSGADSVADTNAGAGKDEKDWRETAMYNGVESPRLPGGDSLSVPSASATAGLKASASLGGGIAGGFSAGLGAGASAGFGAGMSVGGGISAGISGGFSAAAGISGGLSAGVGGSLSAGISGGVNVGASVETGGSGGLSGGLTTALELEATPPAFSFGASAALGTSIPGAFSADLNSGGGISAGSIVSGAVQLHAGASASASAGTTFASSASGSANARASIGFD